MEYESKVTRLSGVHKFHNAINSGDVVILDFWATWQGPCRVISPHFEKLAGEVAGPKFYKVDIDEEPDITQEAGIRAIPTFLAYKDGQVVEFLVGANLNKLTELVKKFQQ